MSTQIEAVARRLWSRVPERPRTWIRSVRYPAPAQRQWMRVVMNREADQFFRSLPPETRDAVEISGDVRAGLPWRSYRSANYPEFDLCSTTPPNESYDVVICEQVLEHVPDLARAVENLRALCRPGGAVFVSTPFLVKIHGHPDDFWRLTASGMRFALERVGLEVEWVHTWGNRRCARSNLKRWTAYHRWWSSLRNEPDVPLVVWALARRPTS